MDPDQLGPLGGAPFNPEPQGPGTAYETPPILVAGGGERKTLRLVARYADACHLPDTGGPYGGDLAHKLRVLRGHCEAVGRDYAQIEKTVGTQVDLSGDSAAGLAAFRARLGELAALGIDHVIEVPRGPWTAGGLAAVASILPEIRVLPSPS